MMIKELVAVDEFTITRSDWDRGRSGVGMKMKKGKHNDSNTSMHGPNGMCCLGFYLKACGLGDKIANVSYPTGVDECNHTDHQAHWLVAPIADKLAGTTLRLQTDIANVNDAQDATEEYRENFITKAFAVQGIKVNFVD